MISREKYLLGVLAEEAAEVSQRAIKAQRFGLNEMQPGQDLTNVERLVNELVDVVAVCGMLSLPHPDHLDDKINIKIAKVEKYWAYSVELGEANDDR